MSEQTNDILDVFILILAVIISVVIIVGYVTKGLIPFRTEKEFIKTQMYESDGREYRYWKKQLVYLHLRLIPIFGLFFSGR